MSLNGGVGVMVVLDSGTESDAGFFVAVVSCREEEVLEEEIFIGVDSFVSFSFLVVFDGMGLGGVVGMEGLFFVYFPVI
jgi:hypothetical protein